MRNKKVEAGKKLGGGEIDFLPLKSETPGIVPVPAANKPGPATLPMRKRDAWPPGLDAPYLTRAGAAGKPSAGIGLAGPTPTAAARGSYIAQLGSAPVKAVVAWDKLRRPGPE